MNLLFQLLNIHLEISNLVPQRPDVSFEFSDGFVLALHQLFVVSDLHLEGFLLLLVLVLANPGVLELSHDVVDRLLVLGVSSLDGILLVLQILHKSLTVLYVVLVVLLQALGGLPGLRQFSLKVRHLLYKGGFCRSQIGD